MICDRDCLNCKFEDCIEDELTLEDRRNLAAMEAELLFPKTRKERRTAAYKKAYYEAHRDEIAAYGKAYYEAHKDEIAANKKAYREAHKDEIAAYGKAYREKKKAVPVVAHQDGQAGQTASNSTPSL